MIRPSQIKTMESIPVQGYECLICHKLFRDKEKADKCTKSCARDQYLSELEERREQKLDVKKNIPRLNATTAKEAIDLLVKNCKEFGLTVKFTQYPNRFGDVCNSHGAPVGYPTNWGDRIKGLPTYYIGWSGSWKGTVRGKCPLKNCWERNKPELRCVFEHTSNGFHFGTGCAGDDFDISGYFFLNDFPKMCTAGGLIKVFQEQESKLSNLTLLEKTPKMAEQLQAAMKNPIKPKELKFDIWSEGILKNGRGW